MQRSRVQIKAVEVVAVELALLFLIVRGGRCCSGRSMLQGPVEVAAVGRGSAVGRGCIGRSRFSGRSRLQRSAEVAALNRGCSARSRLQRSAEVA